MVFLLAKTQNTFAPQQITTSSSKKTQKIQKRSSCLEFTMPGFLVVFLLWQKCKEQ